jgi:LysR family transcriptional regulator (chromosome initiation inhibitor)
MQLEYTQLSALAAILRNGSFEAAADELGLTQSAVSQRIKALEEHCGTLLVQRGKPCTGTEAGRRIAAHAEHVALLERQVVQDLGHATLTKGARLRVVVNADSLATWFLKAAAPVPDQLFDIVVDDQDFSVELLKQGEVAAAVTSHDKPIAGCDSFFLGNLRYIATASPDFVANHFADGVSARTLSLAPMLRFNTKDTLQERWIKQVCGQTVHPPFHSIASSQAFVEASLLGMGWGMNPEQLVRDHIASGQLQELVPGGAMDTPLYWQVSRLMRPALQPLTKSVRQTARTSLPQS